MQLYLSNCACFYPSQVHALHALGLVSSLDALVMHLYAPKKIGFANFVSVGKANTWLG